MAGLRLGGGNEVPCHITFDAKVPGARALTNPTITLASPPFTSRPTGIPLRPTPSKNYYKSPHTLSQLLSGADIAEVAMAVVLLPSRLASKSAAQHLDIEIVCRGPNA